MVTAAMLNDAVKESLKEHQARIAKLIQAEIESALFAGQAAQAESTLECWYEESSGQVTAREPAVEAPQTPPVRRAMHLGPGPVR